MAGKGHSLRSFHSARVILYRCSSVLKQTSIIGLSVRNDASNGCLLRDHPAFSNVRTSQALNVLEIQCYRDNTLIISAEDPWFETG